MRLEGCLNLPGNPLREISGVLSDGGPGQHDSTLVVQPDHLVRPLATSSAATATHLPDGPALPDPACRLPQQPLRLADGTRSRFHPAKSSVLDRNASMEWDRR